MLVLPVRFIQLAISKSLCASNLFLRASSFNFCASRTLDMCCLKEDAVACPMWVGALSLSSMTL